jgi:preprotein translocase subunit SecG
MNSPNNQNDRTSTERKSQTEAMTDKAVSKNWLKRHTGILAIVGLIIIIGLAAGVVLLATSKNHSTSQKQVSAQQQLATTQTAKPATTNEKSVVPTQSSFLAGNAHPQFPAGPNGQVSVVYQAPISPQQNGTIVPIVLDNNSSKAVAHVDISGTAKDAAGKIVGSGASQGTYPSVIKPGQWALAFIYFQSSDGLAPSDTMSFSVNTSQADTSSYNTAAVQVTQANMSSSGSITGGVQNTTGHVVTGPISVDAYCFDAKGHPVYEQGGFTSGSGDLAPNATDSFQIDFNDQQCPSYLVGASGYYK